MQMLVSLRSCWRRPILLGLAFCAIGLALVGATSVAGQAQARTAIFANVSSSIEIEVPSEIQWGDLCLGTNVSVPQQVRVRSNKPFTLKIRSVTRTHMAEFDLTTQEWVTGGRSLSESLRWKLLDGESEPVQLSRTDMDIMAACPPTSDSGRTFDICFVQEVSFGDERLEEGKVYRIDVIFTAIQDV
mgnify:CR=1 FL=1